MIKIGYKVVKMKAIRDIHDESVLVFDQDDLETMVEGETYKMLQLMIDNKPKILFGLTSSYHSQILEAYLLEIGVSFRKTEIEATPLPGPAPLGETYKLMGAGRAVKTESFLKLYGESIGYRIRPSVSHGKELRQILDRSIDLSVDGRIVEKAAIVVPEKELLDYKLQFLHSCLAASDFESADQYLAQLREVTRPISEEAKKLDLVCPLYDELKEISKTKDCFDKGYVITLTWIRDILLD
jgi:hypothetical protein